MTAERSSTAVVVRRLEPGDLDEVVRIDGLHRGAPQPEYWRRVFGEFFGAEGGERLRVGFAAEAKGRLAGFLLGEVRAFEFGSEACGWIFAVGVEPAYLRQGLASSLLAAACESFAEAGVKRVRTMVRRRDVPVLAFFRSQGFVGGSFVQLEKDLEESR